MLYDKGRVHLIRGQKVWTSPVWTSPDFFQGELIEPVPKVQVGRWKLHKLKSNYISGHFKERLEGAMSGEESKLNKK